MWASMQQFLNFSKPLIFIQDWENREEEDTLLIERILLLLRNILHVPADPQAEKVFTMWIYRGCMLSIHKIGFMLRMHHISPSAKMYPFLGIFGRLLKVAPYSFLKSGKHMFQTQNLVHWYFVRRMKPNVWYRTVFWESETVTKKCVTVVAMATMTFQNGC